MGCCGCRSILEKAEADLGASMIASEANDVFREAARLFDQVKEIEAGPMTHGDVRNWEKGEYASYVQFEKDLAEEKNKKEEAGSILKPMTRKHYEAAATEAAKFYGEMRKTNKSYLPAPDLDWPLVVSALASKEEDLRQIESRLRQCRDSYEIHLRNEETIQTQVKGKVVALTQTDTAAELKLKEVQKLLEKVGEVAKESRMMLRVFYVEVEEEQEGRVGKEGRDKTSDKP